MTESNTPGAPGEGGEHIQGEQLHTSHMSARVPDHVSRGVFSTGMIVMTGATEFVLDFVQNVGRPHQVGARVVMPHGALPQFAEALRKNIELYRQRFGDPPSIPRVDIPKRPTIQEIYDDLKLPDETLSGAYANGVMISHTAAEFMLDFLTTFFPRSAVSCRVFLSAAQAPRILESLDGTNKQFQERFRPPQPPPPDQPPPGSRSREPSGTRRKRTLPICTTPRAERDAAQAYASHLHHPASRAQHIDRGWSCLLNRTWNRGPARLAGPTRSPTCPSRRSRTAAPDRADTCGRRRLPDGSRSAPVACGVPSEAPA